MAQIKLELSTALVDGMDVKFKAPCNCDAVTGLLVSYPSASGALEEKSFTFRDSHRNDLTGIGNLFSSGAYVKAILDTTNGHAYLQNADTNAYIERKIKAVTVELPAVNWTDNAQTVAAQGVTADNTIIASAAPDSLAAYGENGVKCDAQATNALTFVCDAVPSVALTVNVVILN